MDFVFIHLVTEHVLDLRSFFRELASLLRPGTTIMVHHDCYYQPAGHHDHGFVCMDPATWFIEPQVVPCWDAGEKCEASAAHRAGLHGTRPFQWSSASEATRDPEHCDRCNYYRRSWPWAHLMYGDDLTSVYPEPWFEEHLNRATTRQVGWYMQEAGFRTVARRRLFVENIPPEHLVYEHGREELTTFTLSVRAILEPRVRS